MGKSIIQMSFQDETGQYYTSVLRPDGSWFVDTTPTLTYLTSLPEGWDGTEIGWVRNPAYLGIMRSYVKSLTFSKGERAILMELYRQKFAQAFCTFTVYQINTADANYHVAFKTQLDFRKFNNDVQLEKLSIGTLDGQLYKDFNLWSSVNFNLPLWVYDSTLGNWVPQGIFVNHDGIKLMYSATWTGTATPTTPFVPQVDFGNWLSIPALNLITITKPQGSTNYVGADILQAYLKQNAQIPAFINSNPALGNTIPAYSPVNNVMLDIAIGAQMVANVTATVTQVTYPNPNVSDTFTFDFWWYEVDNTNTSTNRILLYSIPLPHDTGTPVGNLVTLVFPSPLEINANSVSPMPFRDDYVYLFLYTFTTSAPPAGLLTAATATFTNLQYTIFSDAINAPKLPDTPFTGFRAYQVLEKLVPLLNSVSTDAYGFPIVPAGTTYTGVSDYLSDPTQTLANNYDNIPYQTVWTCGNALRLSSGQPYITTSLDEFYRVAFGVWGCGLGIENDPITGDPTVIRVEPLSYFFDKNAEILDLGYDVVSYKYEPFTDKMGAKLKAGYSDQQYNNDYGIDEFNRAMEFKTPLNEPKGEISDIAPIRADIYGIEFTRAEKNIGDSSSPNSSNDNFLIEITDTASASVTVDTPSPTTLNPTGTLTTPAFELLKYPTAQNTTPTAPPYLNGLYFPDTAYNLGLTPVSNEKRKGSYLSALCQGCAGLNIQFVKQYQLLYNDTTSGVPSALARPGLTKNLNAGLISEAADIPINDLPDPLFKPVMITVTSKYPVNMYDIVNNNPYGYIKFSVIDPRQYGAITEVKGFIWEVKQIIGSKAQTEFKLLAHPDMVF